MAGLPLPLVELRARDDTGAEIPWDDETMGELEVRGPWVAAGYYGAPDQAHRWTEDGWFRTGDIVSMHPRGFIRVQDRSKDVIKSGGEWISSVALENALMGHPAVAEAAVIAVPDEKWAERPLAAVALKEGASATAEELREFLAPQFAKWWLPDVFKQGQSATPEELRTFISGDFARWQLPDRFEVLDEIPKTAVGKFRKTALREMFVPATEKAPTA
jgi:fatty-acyl-CoA synthase